MALKYERTTEITKRGRCDHRRAGKWVSLKADREHSTAGCDAAEEAGAKHTGCVGQGKV